MNIRVGACVMAYWHCNILLADITSSDLIVNNRIMYRQRLDLLFMFENHYNMSTQLVSNHFSSLDDSINEPRHDKTNKMSVRPAKTQIGLDIRSD